MNQARKPKGRPANPKPKPRPKPDDIVIIWLRGSKIPMRVKRKTAEKLIAREKATLEQPQAAIRVKKSLRVIQLFETGEIKKVSDAEAARLVENEEAGYIL